MRHHPDKLEPRTAYQRARIMTAITEKPLTAQELADRLHLTRDGINIHLKAMKEASPRQVHVASWVYNPKGGRPAPQYSPGDQPDAEYVASRTPTRHLQTAKQKSRILELLESKKMTILQLAAEIARSHQWTRHMIAELRAEKQVHIGGWQRQVAGIAPLYAVGDKRDVPKQQHTKTDWQRLKARIKADPDARERYELSKKRRSINDRIQRMKPVTWFGALPGAQAVAKEAA